MTQKSLLERTLELLEQANARGITYLDIHQATSLQPVWLTAIRTGSIKDPGVNKIQKLHDYLLGVVA